jgi:hypothetical protein
MTLEQDTEIQAGTTAWTRRERLALTMGMAGLLSSCAPMHDLKNEGASLFGGGFYDREIRPGIYWLSAKTNAAVFVNVSGARNTWVARADQLCGRGSYSEYQVAESTYERPGSSGHPWLSNPIISQRQGYIACHAAGQSDENVREVISEIDSSEKRFMPQPAPPAMSNRLSK